MKKLFYQVAILMAMGLPATVSAQFLFEDRTVAAKINQQHSGTQSIGPGVVVLDFNGDGWDDLYLPGGQDSDKLFRNNGNGTFTEISDSTFKVHNNFRSRPRGGTAFDFDNDGLTDLY